MENVKPWEFNSDIAVGFSNYARKHIPNYDQVIDQSISICETYNKNDKIVEIGCASGETIQRLHNAGFRNLIGIDNSQSMLDVCPVNLALYINSNDYPAIDNVSVAIMNWTLHFINNKIVYLEKIFNSLNSNGCLILSEKVSLDNLMIRKYHEHKKTMGVCDKEIKEKEQQIKDTMFINNTEWYYSALKSVGFKNIHVINASWCFNTFLASK
jgi:trans-aconitate methyltransferase